MKAKRVAWDIESIDKDYERLWRKEDESIPQFIPIRPKAPEGELGVASSRPSQQVVEVGPKPLAVREHVPLLALPAPGTEGRLESVERRLEAS